ncbi:ETS-related transcription factor Elf-3-like isoform X3 [Thrips palmi]|uniref:ETS-related transcription factor Elf-3-like isoform X3 n=2 Tax=Thrips palmi TaxID=161013 RepID=A0A6P8ZC21_THRPL|nr:ETS-related transcription factor Elf-3-like isoform X3 [Thrips palmi]
MRIMSEEPYMSLLSSPRQGHDDAAWPYNNMGAPMMPYYPEGAASLGNPHNTNASRWIQQVLARHRICSFEMRQALESLGGFSTDDLRMLTRADLATRTNKRVAEVIFEALDSYDLSLSESSLDSLSSGPHSTHFEYACESVGLDDFLDKTAQQVFTEVTNAPQSTSWDSGNMTSASITNSTAATGRLLPLEAAAPAEARGTLRTRTISEDSTCSSEAPPRRRGGRQKRSTNPNSGRRPNGRARQAAPAGRLWQFLLRLLNDAQYSPAVIRWEDKENGVFCFVHGHRVAEMWGQHKGNQAMNYEKMTRTMRTYKNEAFEPHPKRLVYKFGRIAMAPGA